MTNFTLAVEDELSERVMRRIFAEYADGLTPSNVLNRGGNGYLRKSIGNFAKASQWAPVIVFTDLDEEECAPSLIEDWRKHLTFVADNLHIRVAVKEVEAWLVADQQGITDMLGRKSVRVPPNADDVADPKAWILQNALKSPRRIREQLVTTSGGGLRQGLGYNNYIGKWVAEGWHPNTAAANSESLTRTLNFVEAFAAQLTSR